MKILITGGAGFVGANLACLLKQDYPSCNIICLDNLHRRGAELNLSRLRNKGVSFVHGDIRQIDDLESVGDIDLLIECSAEPSALAGYGESPSYVINTNLLGTLNCLEICLRRKADIIFLSSSRVYPIGIIEKEVKYIEEATRFILSPLQSCPGVSEYGFNEDFSLNGIRTIYGATKLCSEFMIQEYVHAYGIRGIINRCGVIAGPWQMGKVDQGFLTLWVFRHLWNGELAYIGYGGTGKQVRDIIHIKDLYRLICIEIEQIEALSGKIFNVGGGEECNISLRELTLLCQEITGKKVPIASIPETRQGDIRYYVSDYRRIQKITKWSPQISVKDIVSDIYKWLREYEAVLKPVLL